MRINRDNYESFLVDYTEGTLSAETMQKVKNFLLQNPEIQDEFDLFSSDILETSNDIFSNKNILKDIPFEKTSSSSEYFQQLCVNFVDEMLPENEMSFFKKLVSNNVEKQKELNLFAKTKLQVEKVQFNEKLLLKKDVFTHIITNDNFEEYCVASVEGWLDLNALTALNNFITDNKTKKSELDLYYKTKLTPDFSITYPDKSKIKYFSILTPTIKKYFSLISASAAIIVFALLVFNTLTVVDETQLAGHISNKVETDFIEQTAANNNREVSNQKVVNENKMGTILYDPFVFEKIKPIKKQLVVNESNQSRILVDPIISIKIQKIECPKCYQQFDDKELVISSINKNYSTKTLNKNTQKNTYEEIIKDNVKAIAEAGLTRVNNKFKNGRLKVKKNDAGDKTLIAFNSKYFSISTNVKSRN